MLIDLGTAWVDADAVAALRRPVMRESDLYSMEVVSHRGDVLATLFLWLHDSDDSQPARWVRETADKINGAQS